MSTPPSAGGAAANGFPQDWERLLQSGQGAAMHPGALRRLVDLTTALLHRAQEADAFDTGPAAEAGALLVDSHFTDPDLLARAIGLLHGSELARGRTAELTGAFAAGWASALRERVLQEQEAIRLAADTARKDAERALRESEARFRALFERRDRHRHRRRRGQHPGGQQGPAGHLRRPPGGHAGPPGQRPGAPGGHSGGVGGV